MTRCLVALLASVATFIVPVFAQTGDETAKARDEIWAKELNIYAGRAKGSVEYYANNASKDYLAWTYGTPKPFRRDQLGGGGGAKMAANEKISTTFKDFSLHGDTAIIYYVNHRTVKPDGTPVDQTFDNIHVWVKEDGTWKVLASMSRLQEKS